MPNLDDEVSASCRLNIVVFQYVDGDPGHDVASVSLGFAFLTYQAKDTKVQSQTATYFARPQAAF